MIPDTVIHNLVAGSAQLALIVTIAALLQWLVRVDARRRPVLLLARDRGALRGPAVDPVLPAAGRTGGAVRGRNRGGRHGSRDRGGG